MALMERKMFSVRIKQTPLKKGMGDILCYLTLINAVLTGTISRIK
jgi:hypothetical protein